MTSGGTTGLRRKWTFEVRARCQYFASRSLSIQWPPRWVVRNAEAVGLVQPVRWTPFVTWPIGTFSDRGAREESLPHLAADISVELTDAVGASAHAEGENGHGEQLTPVVGMDTSEPQELLDRHAQGRGVTTECPVHEPLVKAIMPGGNRGMRGEDASVV